MAKFKKITDWFNNAAGVYAMISSGIATVNSILAYVKDIPLPYIVLIAIFTFGGVLWVLNLLHDRQEKVITNDPEEISTKIRDWLDQVRYAMVGSREQIHRIEPFLEGRMATLKRCSYHRIDEVTAPRTLISLLSGDSGELPMLAAFRAIKGLAIAKLHQVVETARIVLKLFKKLIDCNSEVLPIG